MREFIGQGTLFHQAHLLFGEIAQGLTITLGPGFKGALVAILPPGAFIGLGLLIALKNLIDQRVRRRVFGGVPVRAPSPARTGASSPPGSATA
jgi:electron transport complex protein RnfE